MAGRQAKILTANQLKQALSAASKTRYPTRDRAMLLLSAKAGLRAAEIALANDICKQKSGRTIPINLLLRATLIRLRRRTGSKGHVIKSERGERLSAGSVVNWFRAFYSSLGLQGCSSHSGRRTFITLAARRVSKAGGSIRDVQALAGHRSLSMTQRYIDVSNQAQRRLVTLL